jgi:hypothetical protein
LWSEQKNAQLLGAAGLTRLRKHDVVAIFDEEADRGRVGVRVACGWCAISGHSPGQRVAEADISSAEILQQVSPEAKPW